jgi:hypothetical protein
MQAYSIRFNTIAGMLVVLFFFVFFFLSFLQAGVDNHDFWWHLATGKYIVETGSLPQHDPFSYTTHDTPSDRKSILLKGYWLAQIVFFEVYTMWDVRGIAVLRALLMLLFLLFVFLNVQKQTSSDFTALAFTIIVFLIAVPYSADRPQLFTFLIFSAVYYLLEDFRMKPSGRIFFLPALVTLAANMHPGYIVCILLLSLYLFSSGIHYFVMKDREEGFKLGRLLTIWTLCFLSSLINPADWTVYKELLYLDRNTRGIIEFMPTFFLFARKLTPINYPYILFLCLSLLSLYHFRRIGPTRLVLLVVFSAMSFLSVRYLIFYVCVSAPIIAMTLVGLTRQRTLDKQPGTADARQAFLSLAFCLAGILLVAHSLSGLAKRDLRADFFSPSPKGAADFLATLPVKGAMLNDYGFGGYLIWRLYPDKKVFIDGRMLENDVYNEYETAILTKKNQSQSWEDVIRKYDISYVVVPPLLHLGHITPLAEKMYDSREWVLIYKDHLSLVFLRDEPRNISIVERHTRDKHEVLDAIITLARTRAAGDRTNPYYLISLGKAYLIAGKLDEARKAFLEAYEREPDNPETNRWIGKLGGRG